MRDDCERTEDAAAQDDRSRSGWLPPQLKVVVIDELTTGVSGFNFDGDFSPQS
ncbi:hypothetical protein [Ancylobacter vacuolatus]|uniref:Uncharacterized protein n=1 Tax=Ancylobacter vacuolatus TaxID=223389 RepID=A0ABU0DBA2_9HYPH|nr:hypothetical protein [Ancylobacter vacuolatus]MDQ0345690.1 hypothetical protein [Ancylobacter vacuolatus]